PARVHRRDGGSDQPDDVRKGESGRVRLGHRGGSAPRRGGPDGPRGGVTVREARPPLGGAGRDSKGPGPSSPETTTPAVEPLVRSPATGGRSLLRSVTRPARKVSPSDPEIVQVIAWGT